MVLGGISYYGKTDLILVTGSQSVNAERYQDVLAEAWPSVETIFPSSTNWIFQQDGAKAHTARTTKEWLTEREAIVLDPWPANSPDLNCIENLWSVFKERVYRRKFKTLQGLYRVACEEWANIELSDIRKLVLSLPERLAQVRERDGGYTDY